MPVTLVTLSAVSLDGAEHDVRVKLHLSDRLCYDGDIRPAMSGASFVLNGKNTAWCGQTTQKPLSHSADHSTIDWGYLYLSADGETTLVGDGLQTCCSLSAGGPAAHLIIAYDDIASMINYFGDLCKPWYRRDGRQITDAIRCVQEHFDTILNDCARLDARLAEDARNAAGEGYERLVNAAWRHTFAAHKLIATPAGEMALSLQGERLQRLHRHRGCELSFHPDFSAKYCPELVNALCRPVLEFASMPVWTADSPPTMWAAILWPPARSMPPQARRSGGVLSALLPLSRRDRCVGRPLSDAGGGMRQYAHHAGGRPRLWRRPRAGQAVSLPAGHLGAVPCKIR